jgi:hypothetical protein
MNQMTAHVSVFRNCNQLSRGSEIPSKTTKYKKKKKKKKKKNRQHNGQKKKDKMANNDLQNIHIKLKIEQHELH